MRPLIVTAFAVVSLAGACEAGDWSLSAMSHGPRSASRYEAPAPRWRAAAVRRPRRHRYDHVAAPELRDRHEDVRAYRHVGADRPRRRGVQCEAKVRGLGTQWIGEEGALEAARKDWRERVRYDLGEAFLDMGNAADEIHRCGRVSIGEVAGQVMHRCEIVASPCKGVFAGSDKD